MAYFLKIIYIFVISLSVSPLHMSELYSPKKIRPGYHLEGGVIIAKYVSTSLEQCIEFCLVKSKCISVELEVRFHLCRLFSSNRMSNGVELKRKPGVWYSEKRNWLKETIDNQCLVDCSSTDTCFVNGSTFCIKTECGQPPILDNTSMIFGSELNIGSKVMYTCKDVENVTAISVCERNGTWSLQEFTCPKAISCLDGWIHFQDSCYLFQEEEQNFFYAEQHCSVLGARLVIVETAEENTFLIHSLNSRQVNSYWIGMTFTSSGLWKWSANNAHLTFSDWAPDALRKSYQTCAVFDSTKAYQWTYVSCFSPFNTICEMVIAAK